MLNNQLIIQNKKTWFLLYIMDRRLADSQGTARYHRNEFVIISNLTISNLLYGKGHDKRFAKGYQNVS